EDLSRRRRACHALRGPQFARRHLGRGWHDYRHVQSRRWSLACSGIRRNSRIDQPPIDHRHPWGRIRWPQILPGGQDVLFTGIPADTTDSYENGSIQVLALKTGRVKEVQRGGYFARYMATAGRTGELLYVHQGTLYGVAFNPDRLEVRGTPVPLLEDVAGEPDNGAGGVGFLRPGGFFFITGGLGT